MKKFFQNLDNDLRNSLLKQLRTLWTHSSTAIEGNTLTLGETDFILNEGLTVSGKPLKDHKEVEGHARAIELLYGMLEKEKITEEDLFLLHKALQTDVIVDIYCPVGAWKVENNGTYHIDEDGKQVFINYAEPKNVPDLMNKWLEMLKRAKKNLSEKDAAKFYAELHLSFVSIHPFADANGRMARLVSNIPVIRAGYPPITINKTHRREYIALLSNYQQNYPPSSDNLFPPPDCDDFIKFIMNEWQDSIELVKNAYNEQKKRDNKK